MDLEPGETYQAYISFYLGKDQERKSGSRGTGKYVTGEKGTKKPDKGKPIFYPMILNRIKGFDGAGDEGTVYTVKASAMKNMVTWGSLAIAAVGAAMSIY